MTPILFHPGYADTEWDVSHSSGEGALHCGRLPRREDAPSEIASTGPPRLFGHTDLQEYSTLENKTAASFQQRRAWEQDREQ